MFWTWSSCFATSTIFEFFISLCYIVYVLQIHILRILQSETSTLNVLRVYLRPVHFLQATFYDLTLQTMQLQICFTTILWTCMFYKVHSCFTSATFLRSFRFTIVAQTMFITVHVFAVYHLLLHVYHVLHMQCRFYTVIVLHCRRFTSRDGFP